MTRRDLLKFLLTTAVAEAVDVEKLLWVPKPIVTVPALPWFKLGPNDDVYGILRSGRCEFSIGYAPVAYDNTLRFLSFEELTPISVHILPLQKV